LLVGRNTVFDQARADVLNETAHGAGDTVYVAS
jgi:hypothetical protein